MEETDVKRKLAGDSVVAEFASAVEAVRAAGASCRVRRQVP